MNPYSLLKIFSTYLSFSSFCVLASDKEELSVTLLEGYCTPRARGLRDSICQMSLN